MKITLLDIIPILIGVRRIRTQAIGFEDPEYEITDSGCVSVGCIADFHFISRRLMLGPSVRLAASQGLEP